MSCNCPCPPPSFPPAISIAPGLSRLPRQVIGFPEYREAMLAAIRGKPALASWRAREGDDLGIMMLEWAAYVFDVAAFYDARTTEEAYIRTARDLPSVREIAALVGHRPRPAIAARADLSAITDPDTAVTVPKGMQFRSAGFDGNPPQIFEADADSAADSMRNQWRLAPIAPATASVDSPILFNAQGMRLVKGMIAVFALPTGTSLAAEIVDLTTYAGLDGKNYVRPVLSPSVSVPDGTALSDIAATCSTQAARLSGLLTPSASGNLILDGLYPQFAQGQQVAVKTASAVGLFQVETVTTSSNIAATGTQTLPVAIATELTLSKLGAMEVPSGDFASVSVHFNFQRAGTLALPALAQVDASLLSGSLSLNGLNAPLDEIGGTFLMLDKRDAGAELDATLAVDRFGRGAIDISTPPDLATPLTAPIRIFGNTVSLSRGETVPREVLGSGDATAAFQTFKLQRKPLTYLPSGSAPDGYASTLQIRANGVLWREVDSFFGIGPSNQVYIVRHDEAGESYVTFGDGTYGARLPTGSGNVIASYRTGAGQAKPPAMSIRQAVTPLKGLSQVFNPLGARGGSDAESPDEIRTQAALGALTFGRAVSLADFEAMARNYPGVVNATAGWAWDGQLQRALVTIWYISDGGDLTADLRSWLADRSDPGVGLSVHAATPVPVTLGLEMDFDPALDGDSVEASVYAALGDPQNGILSHARVPIGGSIFRSALFQAVLAVPGVAAVTNLTTAVNGGGAAPMPFALTADEGTFLDFLPLGTS